MSTRVPVKSILKQQPQPSATDDSKKAQAEKDRHNLNIALQHAYKIQHQKDVEAQILSSIELLLDFPHTATATSQEATQFTTLVQPFQPSDLDALSEERRVAGRCGYALCAKTPRSVTLGETAAWKVGKGGLDYCGNVCMRKALYVKAQLSEVPAWEREPGRRVKVVLFEDDGVSQAASSGLSGSGANKQSSTVPVNASDLAAERGEKAASLRPKQVMADRIVEKRTVVYKPLSGLDKAAVSHTAVEGYEPKRKAKARFTDDDDDDDDDGNEDEAGLRGALEDDEGQDEDE